MNKKKKITENRRNSKKLDLDERGRDKWEREIGR